MKKIVMIALLLAELSVASVCGLPWPTYKIEFTDSTLWWRDKDSFWGAGPLLQNGELSYILEDGYNCKKERNEKSFLDSNTYLYRENSAARCLGCQQIDIVQNELSTYEIGVVFKEEFLHWQRCGMLNLTYESADSLITPLIEAMNAELGSDSYYESDYFFVRIYSGEIPDQIVKWAKDACAKTSIVQPRKLARADVFFENGLVHVPERLIGQRYFVFDLNGKVIQKGFAGETIRMPNMHSILKVGKEKPTLLKD